MGHPEIFLEHHGLGKTVRRRRVTSRTPLYVIGSAKGADFRIPDNTIAGCQAVLQYRDSQWYLLNVTADGPAVCLNSEPIVEAKLDINSDVQIGKHRLVLFSPERTEKLFTRSSKEEGLLTHHLVVVTDHRGKLLLTKVLNKTESFKSVWGSFVAPSGSDWIETRAKERVIRQRLITEQEAAATEGLGLDREMKKPLLVALALFAFLFAAILLAPKAPTEHPELALDQKSIDMIFNADAIKKKRMEAKKVTQSAKLRSGGNPNAVATNSPISQPDQSMAPVKSAKASAAMNSIRNAGLASLVGKIAKRANRNGVMVAAQGASPDVKGSGRAFFSNGTATVGGGGGAAVAGNTYRLGGIATHGKGGGATGVRDGTALAGGTVGTGDVAMVDEETIIDGGLDRDVIAEVIKRNLGQIRYCYERQLSSNPDLYGKLLVRFTIDAAGGVMEPSIGTSTLKSGLVEGCVLRRLAGWKFPLPKGGTHVRVSYPFLFKALD